MVCSSGHLLASADAAGEHEGHVGGAARRGQRVHVLARLDRAHLQDEGRRQGVAGADSVDRLGTGRHELGCRRQVGDGRFAAGDRLHALGAEAGHGDDGVGLVEPAPQQHPLAPRTQPAEGPRHIEDRHVVHRRHARRARTPRQVDVEPVDEVGRSHRAQALEGPAGTVDHRPGDPAHTVGKFGDRVGLDVGDEVRRRHAG